MGYPWDKTFLEKIQSNKTECKGIRALFWNLSMKYKIDNNLPIGEDLTIRKYFELLGEAFELESYEVGLEHLNECEAHYFMWDVLDNLLGSEDA